MSIPIRKRGPLASISGLSTHSSCRLAAVQPMVLSPYGHHGNQHVDPTYAAHYLHNGRYVPMPQAAFFPMAGAGAPGPANMSAGAAVQSPLSSFNGASGNIASGSTAAAPPSSVSSTSTSGNGAPGAAYAQYLAAATAQAQRYPAANGMASAYGQLQHPYPGFSGNGSYGGQQQQQQDRIPASINPHVANPMSPPMPRMPMLNIGAQGQNFPSLNAYAQQQQQQHGSGSGSDVFDRNAGMGGWRKETV